MLTLAEGKLLWTPSEAFKQRSQLAHFMRWLREQRGRDYTDYDALWQWSVSDLEGFWSAIADYFQLRLHRPYAAVLENPVMPGARWFVGAELNYAEQVFQRASDKQPALRFASETEPLREISWAELKQQVAALAQSLRELGVVKGDRVASYMPNIPATIVAFLATASIGAIWSGCAPDMGQVAVLDRFRQIEPKVLFAVDGYHYGGKAFDRGDVVAQLRAELTSLRHIVVVPRLAEKVDAQRFPGALAWPDLLRSEAVFAPVPVPFDHPLWIVYSSGTTGMPKPIVHGHGGIALEQMKQAAFHINIGADDVYHWYSSAGWIMWNQQLAMLLLGATVAIYDGNPGYPDLGRLWRFADEAGATVFGAGAAFYTNCMKAGIEPAKIADLSRLRGIGSTGSPLPAEAYEWIYSAVRSDIWLAPVSGGTDFAGAFVGGCPLRPVYSGEMQCRCLGAKVEAYDDAGRALIDEVGELVCTVPMPSMPLYFWNDAGGKRLRESYFDLYPGVWRHGDWIKITSRGGAIIYGRSDATINRHGIRMGTSELYRVVEDLPQVLDSLVVDLEYLGRESYMPLFVVMRPGAVLDEALQEAINARIRAALSARHVPNVIVQVPEIPRTLSGKKMEVPIKKLLLGQPLEKIANRDAMANPASLDWFAQYAAQFLRRKS